MLLLSVENSPLNTDTLNEEVHYSILSFQDYKNPDFFMSKLEYIDEFNSASITLHFGEYDDENNEFTKIYEIVMPLHWSILCTDYEYVQSIPLYEASGRDFLAFCLNPLDGFIPQFLTVRTGTIFPNTSWTAPQIQDKDMLVVPLGDLVRKIPNHSTKRGPVCAMFSPSKFEVNKLISEIW
jgi:hypothetical protein